MSGVDQHALAHELRRRAEKMGGHAGRELQELATLIDTEHHPHELARWLTDITEIGRNGGDADQRTEGPFALSSASTCPTSCHG
jgi:hypothetical protein